MAQKLGRNLKVCGGLRDDADGINLPQQLPVIGQAGHAQLSGNGRPSGFMAVYYCHQFAARQGGIFLRVKAPQVTDADNGRFDVLHLDIMPVVSASQRKAVQDSPLGTEFIRLGLGVVVGLGVIPPLSWLAGHIVIGEYIRDPLTGATGGPLALWSDFLQQLLQGAPAYWVACAGPYVAARILRKLLGL